MCQITLLPPDGCDEVLHPSHELKYGTIITGLKFGKHEQVLLMNMYALNQEIIANFL